MLQELSTFDKWISADEVRHLLPEGDRPLEVSSEHALATWWQQKTSGTTYIRCHVPARALPGNSYSLKYSDLKLGEEGEVYVPRNEGTAIWQFVGNATRALIMAHLQEQGVRCLMEVDDNYLTPPPPVPNTRGDWSHKLDRSEQDRYSFQAHRKIIRWVDGIIASTDEIAERYAKHTSAPIYVCPNSADLDDWPDLPEDAGRVGKRRHIGFAGSASHRYDVALVERALDLAARSGATIHKLGGAMTTWRFPHESMPWTDDLEQYRRNLQALDVGLCPLKSGDWQACKSDLKCQEYLLAGVVPIVQRDSPAYKEWIDIVPSASTEKEWVKVIRWALNAPEDELYDAWRRGYDYLLANKLIQQNIWKWRAAL